MFFLFFFSEFPKNLLQDFGSRFFNFIIFLDIIILEKLEMLEIYKKNQITYFTIKNLPILNLPIFYQITYLN